MPPPAIKTVRQIIYYQYAKIISESSGFGKSNYYLKYLYSLHEKNNTLDESDVTKLCPECNMQKNCEKENSVEKLSVYCIEGCFFQNNKLKE